MENWKININDGSFNERTQRKVIIIIFFKLLEFGQFKLKKIMNKLLVQVQMDHALFGI